MKRYRLVKDLPDCKSGSTFHWEEGIGQYVHSMRGVGYSKEVVESPNNEWWEEVKEERIEVRIEYGHSVGDDERLYSIYVQNSKWIPQEKFPLIKQAIESILNDDAKNESRAEFLWGFDDDSIESLGYEVVNAKTELYRKECWDALVQKIKESATSSLNDDAGEQDLEDIKQELKVTEELLNERQKVLDAIPACPAHGGNCVPHALEWVKIMKEKASEPKIASYGFMHFPGGHLEGKKVDAGEGFVWTDELVKDFIHIAFAPCDPNHPFMEQRMAEFKQSKQQPSSNTITLSEVVAEYKGRPQMSSEDYAKQVQELSKFYGNNILCEECGEIGKHKEGCSQSGAVTVTLRPQMHPASPDSVTIKLTKEQSDKFFDDYKKAQHQSSKESVEQFNKRVSDHLDKVSSSNTSTNEGKDWEIVELRGKSSGSIYRKSKGMWLNDMECGWGIGSDENELENSGCEIHSVKRLSDGEVFTVGDKCSYSNPKCSAGIDAFDIYNHPDKGVMCRAIFKKYSWHDGYYASINEIEKLPSPSSKPEPLFRTEDGKGIEQGYKGDLWRVFIVNHSYESWKPYNLGMPQFINSKEEKYFSTEEAANDYCILNKPCLSVNDVIGVLDQSGISKYSRQIKIFAQSKLNTIKP